MRNDVKSTVVNILAIGLAYLLISFRSDIQSIFTESIIFIVSAYILVKAADIFTELAVFVGDSFGLSKLATGTLIIAIGTSAPELFASIGAAIQNQPDMVVGNVLGTVIANCLLGIGFGAMFAKKALVVHGDVVAWKMSVFLVAILLALVGFFDGSLDYYEGILMLPLLLYYLIFVYRINKNDGNNNHLDNRKSLIGPIALLVVNLSILFISGDSVVSSLLEVSEMLGFSSAILATSVLAVSTSIPEIATAIALVRQNNVDSLFGEIMGSNIFDILGIFGFLSLFGALTMEFTLLLYLSISMIGAYVVVGAMMYDKSINRIEGFALILLFAAFTTQLASIK